jgi:hypothetical protein
MARTRVQSLSARRWAGLLTVLALALCTTGLAESAMAVPMDAMPMSSAPSASSSLSTDRADVQEVAEPSCPMDDLVMDCRPFAQHRSSGAPLPLAVRIPSTATDETAGRPGVQRVPPSPASREGPDLDRLCVSRT